MKKLANFSFLSLGNIFKNKKNQSLKNKELLYYNLKKCYTIDDLEAFIDVKNLTAIDFSIYELIDFNLEINYRRELIKFNDEKFSNRTYSAASIYSLFKKSTSMFFCDALLLHIERNKEHYTENRKNLSIFYNMAIKQCDFLKQQMFLYAA